MGYNAGVRKQHGAQAVGLEVFDLKPIILGGDPTDLKNKVLLTRQQHIEAVRYWNKLIQQLDTKNR